MLNLVKLAVGAATPDAIAAQQERRARDTGAHGGQPFFWTRNYPRQAEAVLDGGSVYWVTAGMLLCRQQVRDIVPDRRDDGSACTAVILHPPIIPVTPRAVRPFQGWRYLAAADAPADLRGSQAAGNELPIGLRRELLALCLI